MTTQLTSAQLAASAYMGHRVQNKNGKKISYWKLRDEKYNTKTVVVSGSFSSRVFTIQ